MKVYIAGPIKGVENYKKSFDEAEELLLEQGHAVLNPAVLPETGFEYREYMSITLKMLEQCEAIYLLRGWENSHGARKELEAALEWEHEVFLED